LEEICGGLHEAHEPAPEARLGSFGRPCVPKGTEQHVILGQRAFSILIGIMLLDCPGRRRGGTKADRLARGP
jgi:hypothetical protein